MSTVLHRRVNRHLQKEVNAFTRISRSRKGISMVTFSALIKELPFSLKDWSGYIHLSERSLQRYIKARKPLGLPYAERVYEIQQVFLLGLEVFGRKEKLDGWLYQPSIPFGGQRPVELLDTSAGSQLVTDELHRIEYGIFA